LRERRYPARGVYVFQPLFQHGGFQAAYAAAGSLNLAVNVAGTNGIRINKRNLPDTGSHEGFSAPAPYPAQPKDDYPAVPKSRRRLPANEKFKALKKR